MNILIAHHVEPIWDKGLKTYGKSLETVCQDIADWITSKETSIHKVIITQFERDTYAQEHEDYYPLFSVLNELGIEVEWQEYGYGWSRESFLPEHHLIHFVEGGQHSEVVLIEDWIRNLKNHTVYLAGAFIGECLEDMQIALNACDVKFKDVPELQT